MPSPSPAVDAALQCVSGPMRPLTPPTADRSNQQSWMVVRRCRGGEFGRESACRARCALRVIVASAISEPGANAAECTPAMSRTSGSPCRVAVHATSGVSVHPDAQPPSETTASARAGAVSGWQQSEVAGSMAACPLALTHSAACGSTPSPDAHSVTRNAIKHRPGRIVPIFGYSDSLLPRVEQARTSIQRPSRPRGRNGLRRRAHPSFRGFRLPRFGTGPPCCRRNPTRERQAERDRGQVAVTLPPDDPVAVCRSPRLCPATLNGRGGT